MKADLNTPDRVLLNLQTAPERMRQVDEHLADGTLSLFTKSVSRMLGHQETSSGRIGRSLDKSTGAELCLLLVSAAAEFETAWNAIRLANVPASRRQSRVGCELVALAVLVALPREKVASLPAKLDLVQALKKHPTKSVADLYRPRVHEQGSLVRVIHPLIKGSSVFPAFLRASRDVLGVPERLVENFREYQREVQHPSSHASVDLWVYHFEGFKDGKAGAWYTAERAESYAQAAGDLANMAHWMAEILDLVAARLGTDDWSEWS